LATVTGHTGKPWGVGFLTWAVNDDLVKVALDHGPQAVMLSFGDPGPLAATAQRDGAVLIVQVTDLDEARRAVDVGAGVIVAQGTEAGGHGGTRSTFPFVPAVVDLVSPTPVLAAGGIGDGRGVAAALALGAAGALVGTRFLVSQEALVDQAAKRAILEAGGNATERSRVFDIARNAPWPERYTARTLRNQFLDRWRDREDELQANAAIKEEYRQAEERSDTSVMSVWAGEAVDLIDSLSSATALVAEMAVAAQTAIDRVDRY
jgi:nitronate monooxygenase